MKRVRWWKAAVLCLAALFGSSVSYAQDTVPWTFDAAIYGYLPTISGKTKFPATGSSASASVDIDSILDNLKFTFMGSFEARKGRWGVYTDLIYLDVGGSKADTRSLALAGVIPANATASVDFDLKGWAWTVAGSYRLVADSDFMTDLLFGARRLDVTPKLGWQFNGNVGSIPLDDRAGSRQAGQANLDAIVGVKGRVAFGEQAKWFIPYYLDGGTGGSRFTWQAMAGVGLLIRLGRGRRRLALHRLRDEVGRRHREPDVQRTRHRGGLPLVRST